MNAYCFATKRQEPIKKILKINKTKNNRYQLEGLTKEGHKVSRFISSTEANKLMNSKSGDGLLQSLGVPIPDNVSSITDKIPLINLLI